MGCCASRFHEDTESRKINFNSSSRSISFYDTNINSNDILKQYEKYVIQAAKKAQEEDDNIY